MDRFPAHWRVWTSAWTAGEMVCLRGPNGAGQDHVAAGVRRSRAACAAPEPTCSASISLLHRRCGSAITSGCWDIGSPLYGDLRVDDQLRHCADAPSAPPSGRDIESGGRAVRASDGRLGEVAIRRLSEGQQRRVALGLPDDRPPADVAFGRTARRDSTALEPRRARRVAGLTQSTLARPSCSRPTRWAALSVAAARQVTACGRSCRRATLRHPMQPTAWLQLDVA